jgi:CheY-like chemotaxis protein
MLAAGFDAHLAKPVDPAELRAALAALLDHGVEVRPPAGGEDTLAAG